MSGEWGFEINELYEYYNFSEMEKQIENLFPNWNLSAQQMIEQIASGDVLAVIWEIIKKGGGYITSEIAGMKYLMITLLVIGILSAVIINLKNIFPNQQIGELSFKYIYLILIVFLVNVGMESVEYVKTGLEELTLFLKMFLPTYFIVVGATGGSASALYYYQIFLLAIYFVEQILVVFVIPLVGCYLLICVMNGVWEEERLVVFAHTIKKGIQFFLKAILTVITGSGLIQSLITPVIDTIKMDAVKKTVETIPGIGELGEGSLQVFLGVGILLKNTLGIILLIIMLAICFVPLLKVFLIMFVVKSCSGLLGIVTEKKITNCMNYIGDGIGLLLQTMFTSVTFFCVLLLIVLFTTNRGMT